MRCAWAQERLVLYLAGELTPKETSRLIGHLERCTACAALAEDLAATQERVEIMLQTDVEPPKTLDARVMAAVRALPVQRPRRFGVSPGWGWQTRFAFAAAACCLVLVGYALGHGFPAASGLELASLGDAKQIQVTSTIFRDSDPQKLSQQLTPLVRFPVRAADLKPEGATLVEGCRTTVDHVPVIKLHYNWQGKSISLFEMDPTKRTPLPLQRMGHEADSYYVHKVGDISYVAWHAGNTDCVMVARSVRMHDLFHLACRACERLESL